MAHRLGSGLPEPQLFRQFQSDGGFLSKVVKRIVKQALLALDYMHPECGIAHKGNSYLVARPTDRNFGVTDVKPDNILVNIGNAETAIEEENATLLPLTSLALNLPCLLIQLSQ